MFATSGSSVSEEDGTDSGSRAMSHAIASVPAALMSLFVIVVHFALIYLFKKRFVRNTLHLNCYENYHENHLENHPEMPDLRGYALTSYFIP